MSDQWRNWRFEPGGQNLSEEGPLATAGVTSQHLEKSLETIVNSDVDVCSLLARKTKNTPKSA